VLDCIIVGGGPAGLSAALLLGRCRGTVLVFDHGRPRNAAAIAMHGFLSRDSIPPSEFRQICRDQLKRYETIGICDSEVTDARAVKKVSRYDARKGVSSDRGVYS
jgi:thioredoxin reductase